MSLNNYDTQLFKPTYDTTERITLRLHLTPNENNDKIEIHNTVFLSDEQHILTFSQNKNK